MERFMGRNQKLVNGEDNRLTLDCFTPFAMTPRLLSRHCEVRSNPEGIDKNNK